MKLPQLSLRELFLLVALVAMGCGWWVDHQRLANAFYQSPFYVLPGNDYAIANQFSEEEDLRPLWIKSDLVGGLIPAAAGSEFQAIATIQLTVVVTLAVGAVL